MQYRQVFDQGVPHRIWKRFCEMVPPDDVTPHLVGLYEVSRGDLLAEECLDWLASRQSIQRAPPGLEALLRWCAENTAIEEAAAAEIEAIGRGGAWDVTLPQFLSRCERILRGYVREELERRWVAVLRRLHANGMYAPGRDDHHRFEVAVLSDDGAELDVHAYFQAGERYCCAQPTCNFIVGVTNWTRVREAMNADGLGGTPPVRIQSWRVTVEAGSVFHSGRMKARGHTTRAAFSYNDGPLFEDPSHLGTYRSLPTSRPGLKKVRM
ncbi:MAG: hypothetical protein QNJ98_20210 [Planctomycetota bacterium]|nr:hypothetical protein [Planctomycetota bacterium]